MQGEHVEVVLEHVVVLAHRGDERGVVVGGDVVAEVVRLPVDDVPAVVVGEDQVDEAHEEAFDLTILERTEQGRVALAHCSLAMTRESICDPPSGNGAHRQVELPLGERAVPRDRRQREACTRKLRVEDVGQHVDDGPLRVDARDVRRRVIERVAAQRFGHEHGRGIVAGAREIAVSRRSRAGRCRRAHLWRMRRSRAAPPARPRARPPDRRSRALRTRRRRPRWTRAGC